MNKSELAKQVELLDLEIDLTDRRLHGIEGIDICTHIVIVPPSSVEILQKVIKYTSGRIMLGLRCIAFEDAKDATMFKLVK